MALATLCRKLQQRGRHLIRPRFHAFVVDHKARPGSGEEAAVVASRLNQMGT